MASKYINKFPIPEDFSDILHDFTKEILRNQPEDIIDFGCEYFKSLKEEIVLDYRKQCQPEECRRDLQTKEMNEMKASIKQNEEKHCPEKMKKGYIEISAEIKSSIIPEKKIEEGKAERMQIEHEKAVKKLVANFVDKILENIWNAHFPNDES